MDETKSTTVADVVGGHNGVTYAGNTIRSIGAVGGSGPATDHGKVATSLLFTGYQYVNVPNNPALDPGTGDFTIDAWVFYVMPTNATRPIVSKSTYGGGATGYYVQINGGMLEFGIMGTMGGAAINSNNFAIQISPNSWHHVAATFTNNPTRLSLYMDGTLKKMVATGNLGNVSSTSDLKIGGIWVVGPGYATATQIAVDEVEIFNRALSLTEIQGIYNAGSAGKCKKK